MITQKLYSPLYVSLRDNDNLDLYDNQNYWCDELTQREAADYADNIEAAISRDRMRHLDTDGGLIDYFHDSATVKAKVHSLFPNVEEHGGKLWGVATLKLHEPLTAEEIDTIKEYWCSQASDGWAEGFEQREIKVPQGELYVSFWSGDDSFRIMTEDEFVQHLSPEQMPHMTQEM